MLLRRLEGISEGRIENKILEAHQGPCPECGKNGSTIDIHWSYRFWSALFYWSWKSKSMVACRECARAAQSEDLVFSAVCGWWSPPGILITPLAIILNIVALCRRMDTPSDRFRKLVRMSLARSLAQAASKETIRSDPLAAARTLAWGEADRANRLFPNDRPGAIRELAKRADELPDLRRALMLSGAWHVISGGFTCLLERSDWLNAEAERAKKLHAGNEAKAVLELLGRCHDTPSQMTQLITMTAAANVFLATDRAKERSNSD
jgi:hypothetical protein